MEPMAVDQAEASTAVFEDLPDEVLAQVLAGSGSRGICSAARACSRLQQLWQRQLAPQACFASAMSQKAGLKDALEDAARRASEGLMGAVDIALVFISGHTLEPGTLDRAREAAANHSTQAAQEHSGHEAEGADIPPARRSARVARRSKSDDAIEAEVAAAGGQVPDHILAKGDPAAYLQRLLPQGCVVVGCMVAGMMGVSEEGSACEIDPMDRGAAGKGVALLLGRVGPGSRVCVATDLQAVGEENILVTPADSFQQWLAAAQGPDAGSLKPSAVWVLMTDGDVLEGPDDEDEDDMSEEDEEDEEMSGRKAARDKTGLLTYLQTTYGSEVVVAGGVSSGRGDLFLAHPTPSSAASHSAAAPTSVGSASRCVPQLPPKGWTPEHVQHTRYVALAICSVKNPNPAAASGSAAPAATSASASHPAGVPAGSALGVRAAAMAMRGLGPLKGACVWQLVSTQRITSNRGGEPMHLVEVVGCHCLGPPGAPPPAAAAEPAGPSEAASADAAAASASSSGDQAQEGSAAAAADAPKLPSSPAAEVASLMIATRRRLPMYVGMWRDDAPGSEGGCTHEVLVSGLGVVGHIAQTSGGARGDLRVCMYLPETDHDTLARIFENGDAHVRMQFVSTTAAACRAQLGHELAALRDACCGVSMSLPGGLVDPRAWGGYAALRANAQAVGARSGTVGVAIFSCTGRGRAVFLRTPGADEDSELNHEAGITDEVMRREVPFAGAYMNGELGPYIKNGYAGWSLTPTVQQALQATSAAGRARSGSAGASSQGAASAAGDGAGSAAGGHCVVVDGRVLPLQQSQMQGYTSMYAVIG